MADEIRVILKICPVKPSGISISSQMPAGQNAVAGGNVNLKVRTPEGADRMWLTIDLVPNGANVRVCKGLNSSMDWLLRWTPGDPGEKILMYIEETIQNPDECDWEYSQAVGSFSGLVAQIYPSITGGPVPENNKDPKPEAVPAIISTMAYIPGEQIFVAWKFFSEAEPITVAQDYFRLNTLTGGRIMKVQQEYTFRTLKDGSTDLRFSGFIYDVAIEGYIYKDMRSSDHYPYTISEWVYLLKNVGKEIPGSAADQTTKPGGGGQASYQLVPFFMRNHGPNFPGTTILYGDYH